MEELWVQKADCIVIRGFFLKNYLFNLFIFGCFGSSLLHVGFL